MDPVSIVSATFIAAITSFLGDTYKEAGKTFFKNLKEYTVNAWKWNGK